MITRSSSVIHGVGGATGSPASRRLVRSTRSATSPAFHEPQADGPVARLSASTRAASRSRVDRLPTSAGHPLGGGRVVEVPPGGRVGQQQVKPDHGDQRVHVVGGQAHPRPDIGGPRSCPPRCGRRGSPFRCRGGGCRASSRSARPTRWARVAALAVASSRWRSTVNRWYGFRWGLFRTAAHSGRYRSSRCRWSRASRAAMAGGPVASTRTRSARRSSGQGSGAPGPCGRAG